MAEVKKVEVTFWRRSKKISDFFDEHPAFEITEVTNWFLGFFFVVAVVWGLFSVPWSTLLSGNPNVTISIGLPWAFFLIDLMNPSKLPIYFFALIGDIIIYLILSYLINILWNLIKIKIKNKDKTPPKLYDTKVVFVKTEQSKQTAQVKTPSQKKTSYAN